MPTSRRPDMFFGWWKDLAVQLSKERGFSTFIYQTYQSTLCSFGTRGIITELATLTGEGVGNANNRRRKAKGDRKMFQSIPNCLLKEVRAVVRCALHSRLVFSRRKLNMFPPYRKTGRGISEADKKIYVALLSFASRSWNIFLASCNSMFSVTTLPLLCSVPWTIKIASPVAHNAQNFAWSPLRAL